MGIKFWSKTNKESSSQDKEDTIYQKTTSIILRNISWFFILFGLSLIFISLWNKLDTQFSNVLEKIGLTILTSGVFAAVLKSFQFIGVFKEEIENVILGSKFIEKRSDLPLLWKKISAAIYKQKFPEISDSLQEIILNSYFPTAHPIYYEEFVVTINIEEITEDFIIKFTQAYRAKVVLAEDAEDVTIHHSFYIDKFDGMENYINEKEYYKIDGKDILKELEHKNTEDEFEIRNDYQTTVKNKKTFILESKERRQYCIKQDNSKIFRVNRITKEMEVSVHYPENVSVTFFSIGTVNSFEKRHLDHKNHISRVYKDGLILPRQGFGLTFALK